LPGADFSTGGGAVTAMARSSDQWPTDDEIIRDIVNQLSDGKRHDAIKQDVVETIQRLRQTCGPAEARNPPTQGFGEDNTAYLKSLSAQAAKLKETICSDPAGVGERIPLFVFALEEFKTASQPGLSEPERIAVMKLAQETALQRMRAMASDLECLQERCKFLLGDMKIFGKERRFAYAKRRAMMEARWILERWGKPVTVGNRSPYVLIAREFCNAIREKPSEDMSKLLREVRDLTMT
jgi:hypothetical protein